MGEQQSGVALTVVRPQSVAGLSPVAPGLVSVESLKQRYNQFNAFVREVMKRDLDYGVIPGTGTKPTLLKPGAEKIGQLFGLTPQFTIVERIEEWHGESPFFSYLIKCQLVSRATSEVVGEGLGCCNSHESKYRYRREFWNDRGDPPKDAGWTLNTRGKRYWFRRIPNPDAADQVNTILKMAKKRAHIDATLTAAAVSEFFTQDVEDIADFEVQDAEIVAPAPAPAAQQQQPQPAAAPPRASAPADGPAKLPEDPDKRRLVQADNRRNAIRGLRDDLVKLDPWNVGQRSLARWLEGVHPDERVFETEKDIWISNDVDRLNKVGVALKATIDALRERAASGARPAGEAVDPPPPNDDDIPF